MFEALLSNRTVSVLVEALPRDVYKRQDFNTLARMASGAAGAELANIVNEAALRAVRAGRKSVTQADLEESIEVVIAGYQKKNSILTDHEKCIVAYHEIGHADVYKRQLKALRPLWRMDDLKCAPRCSAA